MIIDNMLYSFLLMNVIILYCLFVKEIHLVQRFICLSLSLSLFFNKVTLFVFVYCCLCVCHVLVEDFFLTYVDVRHYLNMEHHRKQNVDFSSRIFIFVVKMISLSHFYMYVIYQYNLLKSSQPSYLNQMTYLLRIKKVFFGQTEKCSASYVRLF